MVEERVEVEEGDIYDPHRLPSLWVDQPTADEVRYMIRTAEASEFAEWAKKGCAWIGVEPRLC